MWKGEAEVFVKFQIARSKMTFRDVAKPGTSAGGSLEWLTFKK